MTKLTATFLLFTGCVTPFQPSLDNYKVGDCIYYNYSINQIVEKGTYSVRIKLYGNNQETLYLLSLKELLSAEQIDCFDFFKKETCK